MRAMRTLTLAEIPADQLCPTEIPAPPMPEVIDVYPLFKIPAKSWRKDVGADRVGWTGRLNFDFKQLFPKIGMCEQDMLALVSTTVVDHRGLEGTAITRARAGADPCGHAPGTVKEGNYCVPSGSGKVTVTIVSRREGDCHATLNKIYTDAAKLNVGEWARRAVDNYKALEPVLAKYGYNPGHAPTLARTIVSKYALLNAMWQISARQAQTWRTYTKAIAAEGIVRPEWRSADGFPYLRETDFSPTYKGLSNPFVIPATTTPAPAFKPVFDGRAFLWPHIKPPFEESSDYTWCLFAKYEGGSIFRLSLKKLTVDKGSWDTFVGYLKSAFIYACKGITNDKLQLVRNGAGAVPEPNTQAVVQAWSLAAQACGMIFPDKPTMSCTPAAPPPPPPEVSPTFWDLYQKQILAGGVGLVALLVLKEFMGRGKVKA